jgi:hypothetical protein
VIPGMPRPRLPHIHKQITRHGKTVWYVRRGKGLRIRLRAGYGTLEFQAEYEAALSGNAPATPGKPQSGTLSWLVEQYRDTSTWRDLSAATRRQRENIFKHILASAGREPFAAITQKTIQAGIERRSKTSKHQARHFLDTMRGLFQWALANAHVKADPTTGMKVKKPEAKVSCLGMRMKLSSLSSAGLAGRESASCPISSATQVFVVAMLRNSAGNMSRIV